MASRSPARWLAPLALLGSVAAVLIVVSASGTGRSGDAGATSSTGISEPTATSPTTARTTRTSTTGAAGPRYYVVQDGDVLSAIAGSTGVPLSVIEELNPDVDAQTLHAGQRIKLRP
jgi:LysM repeat protein